MTVADLLNVLLELDQQCVSPRPSAWGKAAMLVQTLADHAEPSMARGSGPDLFGDWRPIDLSPTGKRVKAELSQPTLERIMDLPVKAMVSDASRLLRSIATGCERPPSLVADTAWHVIALADALDRAKGDPRRA